jgi:hypothetical protein
VAPSPKKQGTLPAFVVLDVPGIIDRGENTGRDIGAQRAWLGDRERPRGHRGGSWLARAAWPHGDAPTSTYATQRARGRGSTVPSACFPASEAQRTTCIDGEVAGSEIKCGGRG